MTDRERVAALLVAGCEFTTAQGPGDPLRFGLRPKNPCSLAWIDGKLRAYERV
jgi:hypothetical protein